MAGVLFGITRFTRFHGLVESAMVLIGVAALFTVPHLRIRRIARRLAEHGNLLCTTCYYPLDRLPDHGQCPECGQAYTFDGVRIFWTEAN
jgi:hypothetical protein